MNKRDRLIAQVLIGGVTLLNLQCAFLFIVFPERFAPGFELAGMPGRLAVQGMGILFVMWNVPYLFALADPEKNRRSLVEAALMQAIGLAGESLLLASLPAAYPQLTASITRFVVFDGGGLVALGAALFLATRRSLLRG